MDKHLLEIIVEICFLINKLKHQFYSDESWQVKRVFNCEEEIRRCFDALICSCDLADFQKKYNHIRETVHWHYMVNSTTQTQYEGKQKVISILENLQAALTVLYESLIFH